MTRHSIGIQRVAGSNVKGLEEYFNQINSELIRLAGQDQFQTTRRLGLAREVQALVKEIYGEMGEEILEQMNEMSAYEIDYMTRALETATTADIDSSGTAGMIQRALATPMRVSPGVTQLTIARAVDQYVENKSLDFFKLVSDGVIEGKTSSDMVNDVSELLKVQKGQAESLVRTSTNSIAASTRAQLFEKNDDVISGYEWVAKLDGRTTVICMNLDNQVFKLGKGPLPPAHWRCRSQTVPIVNRKFRKKVNNEPGGIDESYSQWLARQSKQDQIDILGPTRAKLYQDGGLSISKFVDSDYQPLTVAQLKEQESAAFKRAGIE